MHVRVAGYKLPPTVSHALRRSGGIVLDGAGEVAVEDCKVFDVSDAGASTAAGVGNSCVVAAAYEVKNCSAKIKRCQVSRIRI
jgi:hypothetical protein